MTTNSDIANAEVPPLDYGAGIARRGKRWGIASCVRAAVAFAIAAYLFCTVYVVRPQNTVLLVFCWPLAFVIHAFGVWYGVKGLRRDEVRRWAIVGLIAHTFLATPAIVGTFEAAKEVRIAYRYHDGVIIMADR